MFNSKQTKTVLAIATSISATSWRVHAIEPQDVLVFSKEPVSLRPQFAVSETYDDNVFYQPDDKVSDFITTVSPGLKFLVGKNGKNYLELDYTFNQHFYADRSNLDSGEHSLEFRNRLQGNKLTLTGNDRADFLSSPVGLVEEFSTQSPVLPPTGGGGGTGGATGGGTGSTPGETPTPTRGGEVVATVGERNIDRTVQFHAYNLGYEISEKTSAYLQGVYSDTDYQKNVGLYDVNTLRGTVGFAYAAFPKTSFFGEIYYGQTASTPNFPAAKNPHMSFIGGFLGAKGNFTEKLSGVVKVGYEDREFSDNSPAPSSPVVDSLITEQFTDKTSVSLGYSRLQDISIQFGREAYTADVVRLQLNQALGNSGKWLAVIGGTYGNYQYETPGVEDRQYDRYGAYFNLAYQIQVWLTANLGYSFDRVSSSSAGVSSYDVNRITTSLAVGY